jgi:hypothetical protein
MVMVSDGDGDDDGVVMVLVMVMMMVRHLGGPAALGGAAEVRGGEGRAPRRGEQLARAPESVLGGAL